MGWDSSVNEYDIYIGQFLIFLLNADGYVHYSQDYQEDTVVCSYNNLRGTVYDALGKSNSGEVCLQRLPDFWRYIARQQLHS